MFRWLHKYYVNMVDKPSILFKLNIWTNVNIRYFKFKFLKTLFLFISNFDFFSIKFIKVLYKDWIFENFLFKVFGYLSLIIVILYLI